MESPQGERTALRAKLTRAEKRPPATGSILVKLVSGALLLVTVGMFVAGAGARLPRMAGWVPSLAASHAPPYDPAGADSSGDAGVSDALLESWSLDSYSNMTCCMRATLTLRGALLSSDDARVALRYRAQENGAWLWSKAHAVNASGSWKVEVPFCRLRNNAAHEVYGWVSYGSGSGAKKAFWHREFHTAATGYARLDEGPYANVSSGAMPSWSLIGFQSVVLTSRAETDDYDADSFFGLVIVDTAGWVVWYYRLPYNSISWLGEQTAYSVASRLPNNNLVVMYAVKNYERQASEVNSYLLEITPYGELLRETPNSCGGRATSFNQFSHEARPDLESAGYPILTFRRAVSSAYGNASALAKLDGSLAKAWREAEGDGAQVNYLGDELVAWHREGSGGWIQTLYQMFDLVNPLDDALESSAYGASTIGCAGGINGTTSAIDWSHASSASRGTDSNYLVTLRNLDTVLSLHGDGSGVQWALSSSLDLAASHGYAQYALASPAARFYQPHHVSQTASGTLTLIDDGNTRPNCTSQKQAQHCFSRAVAYHLDARNRTATLVWAFASPANSSAAGGVLGQERDDDFNLDGGAVEYLEDSGTYMVAFTNVDLASNAARTRTTVWEVDARGAALASVTPPLNNATLTGSGSYRAFSLSTIAGESSETTLSQMLSTPWVATLGGGSNGSQY